MASLTTDYQSAFAFLENAKRTDCRVADPSAPEPLDSINIGYLSHGFVVDSSGGVSVEPGVQVFTTGWTALEGVMVAAPEPEFNADLRVCIAASNERALQDLLLSFPGGRVGFCYLAADWMVPGIEQVLEGRVLPAREGWYATAETITPHREYPARRIGEEDYALVRGQWSEPVWNEILEGGYGVHVCDVDNELCALCFHWEVEPWRHEVHGLQAVKDYSRPFAESAITSATEEVIARGRIATCTANRDDARDYKEAFRRVGYRKFYRIPSYLGVKRGTGRSVTLPADAFATRRTTVTVSAPSPGEGRVIAKSKDPLLSHYAELAQEGGRREHAQFLMEGLTLVQRALSDGLAVSSILYTPSLLRSPEGIALLGCARQAGIDHYQVTDGLIARVSSARPPLCVMAAVHFRLREADELTAAPGSTLLLAENIQNPDNLGMIARTADAAGAGALVVAGCDPLHKQCVRAARGAIGRIPVFVCGDPVETLQRLDSLGFQVVGAALGGERELYNVSLAPPVAVVVGNEQGGITRPVLEACTTRVAIPMAPGQDSLNVGVAAGVMLYEALRQKSVARSHLLLISA